MTCPDIVDLERFLLRDLEQDRIDALEVHLSSCQTCNGEVQELRSNLQLAPALRRDLLSPDYSSAAGYEPEVIGSCKVIRKLGQGGMGTVYEAQQENPQRVVAIKMIRPELVSKALLDRFRHEAQVLGRLRHPGIAQIYEAGTQQTPFGAQPYYVMELVRGVALTKYADTKQLGTIARLELMAKVCDAVQHAHQRGVIHRDLKPDNILIDESGGTPEPKILDFGVARVIDPDGQTTTLHTSVGQIIGTVAYMSPEQANANPAEIDTRSDVYSLGVICFELLSARLPYRLNPANIAESIRAIVQDEPPTLHSLNRSLRGDITTIVGKALDKDKIRRYQSAAEMAADIRRHLKDEPISAHPPSTIYQVRKFARRNKGLVTGIAAAFVLLIAGVVGTSIGYVKANRARVSADKSAIEAKNEARKQGAVTEFLREMLRAADPTKRSATDMAKGRDVTMLDALNSASDKVNAGSLSKEPEIEIAVRDIMAASYLELGEMNHAEQHMTASLALAQKTYGEDHVETANALNSLSVYHHRMRNDAEAEKLGRKALAFYNQNPSVNQANIAIAANNLAGVLQDGALYDEAESLLRQSLEIRMRLLGREHSDTTAVMNNLASVLGDVGKPQEAEQIYRDVIEINTRLLGEEHVTVAGNLQNLAVLLNERGRYADAEPLQRKALAIHGKLLGEDHPRAALILSNLARTLQAQKKYDQAAEMYKQAIAIHTKHFGEENAHHATLLNNVGTLYVAEDKLDEAEATMRQVLEIRRKVFGPEHLTVASSMHNLAYVLVEKKKFADAEPLYREALAITLARVGESHPETASRQMQLGDCLTQLKQFEQAEPLLLSAYQIYDTTKVEGGKSRNACIRYLTKLYGAWEKPAEAAKWKAMLPATKPSSRPTTQSAATTQGRRGS